jgi:hypothetical protein
MSALKRITIASLLFGLPIVGAFAAGPPNLDVTATCNGAAKFNELGKKNCLEDERAAKSILVQTWSKYKTADAAQCVGTVNTGGPPSYVELLACLEARRDAKEFHEGVSIIQTDKP